jgi:anhydro-N-acetylmuramic acid kinase
MNQNIKNLYAIARKPVRHIIGLMSGTSMDGLDIALCRIEGSGHETKVELVLFDTVDYTDEVKAEIREVFAKHTIDFQYLTLLNAWIGKLHGEMVLSCLKKWDILPVEIDIVASHGQTVFHAPKILHKIEKFPNATLQIGDGDHVAATTGIITISDFRQKHIAAGGEGAPLAVYGDYLIFSKKGENRIMLNMGGIANFTYLPATMDASSVFVTDTGTGNTLLDAMIRHYYPEKAYDKDAEIAKQGQVIPELLAALKDNDFFDAPFPKTTGPELFNIKYVENAVKKAKLDTPLTLSSSSRSGVTVFDLLATLTRFSAETITDAIKKLFEAEKFDKKKIEKVTIYASGGGARNPLLMQMIRELLPTPQYATTDDLHINPDAKEAVLFALLANECLAGGKTDFGKRQGVPSVSMGKISFPT